MNFEEWAKKFSAKWYSGDAEKAWKAAQPQWQPIETAPKDGTMILVCLTKQMNLILRARYSKVHDIWLVDRECENCLDRGIFFHHGDLWVQIPALTPTND